MKIVGIDTGKNGGICCLHSKGVNIGTMPDMKGFASYLKELKADGQPIIVFVEVVQMWVNDMEENKGKVIRLGKLMAHYEKICNTLDLLDIPYIKVAALTWQKYLEKLGVNKKRFANPKNAYKAFAIEKYPQKLKQINLKTADAVCIAWYGNQVARRFPDETKQKIENPETLKLFK